MSAACAPHAAVDPAGRGAEARVRAMASNSPSSNFKAFPSRPYCEANPLTTNRLRGCPAANENYDVVWNLAARASCRIHGLALRAIRLLIGE
jgi:hypothetical protein